MVLNTIAGGIETVIIVHHTDCGLTHLTDDNVRAHLRENAPAKSDLIDSMDFGEIKECVSALALIFSPSANSNVFSMDESVKEDIEIIRSSPYVKVQNIHGFVFDLEHGTLREIVA